MKMHLGARRIQGTNTCQTEREPATLLWETRKRRKRRNKQEEAVDYDISHCRSRNGKTNLTGGNEEEEQEEEEERG